MKKNVWKSLLTLTLSGAMLLGTSFTASAEEMKDITVILDYVPNTNHTGMYIAMEKGYYAEEGLNVNIIEPTDSTASTLVAQGKGDFGITYHEDVTFSHTTEDPLPVKAIATVIPHNTSGIVSLADSGIESPADWEGKTFAGWGGTGEEEMLHVMMDHYDADFSKLTTIISDGTGFEALGKGVDLLWFYEGWDCVIADMNGCKLNMTYCSDVDERLDYYTTLIVTSNEMIENDPETIRAFLRATKKGYMECIEDPDAAAELLAKYCVDSDVEMLKKSQELLADRFMQDQEVWGEMRDSAWTDFMEVMVEYGVLEETIDSSELYTNEFLEK
ncbi:MAG: ABC transporter substrate-binding protein [Clostridiales bacterium]|nr:ABC transporter substrate-binding protein [Candidatus Blautia equi]